MPLSRPEPGTLRWWIIGVVGVSLLTGLVIWRGLATTLGAVTPQVVGYSVESDSELTLTYEVVRPADTALTCELTGLDERKGPVGTVVDEIPAGESPVRREVTIRTTQRAVTGVVTSCVRR